MMRYPMILAAVLLSAATAWAQEAGNQVYRDSGNQAYNQGRPAGAPPPLAGDLLLYDPKDFVAEPYVEAYVLMNVKPDAFVAVFGVAQEGPTALESNRKVDKLVADLSAAVQALGVRASDVYVDFITQNPVYDYQVSGRTAREALTGFQTKKTIAVRYTDRAVLERMVAAAAALGIYDLVKVDYVVADMGPVRERLFEEAAKVVVRKQATYGRLLGVALKTRGVAEERYASFAPDELYKTYTAYEAGSVDTNRSSTRVVDQRKASSSYYDPVTSANFDAVVNPAGIEPTVQCTLFLKVRCTWP
jgi:uncharacterized protein YggE